MNLFTRFPDSDGSSMSPRAVKAMALFTALAISAIIIAAAVLLSSCVHQSVTQPVGPGGAIESVDSTGVTFTDQGKDLWIREGVPAEWFVGNHLTNLQWHAGNSIRLKGKTP